MPGKATAPARINETGNSENGRRNRLDTGQQKLINLKINSEQQNRSGNVHSLPTTITKGSINQFWIDLSEITGFAGLDDLDSFLHP